MTSSRLPAYLSVLLAALTLPVLVAAQPAPDHEHARAEPWEAPTHRPDRIALTWKEDPATSLSITWRTDTTVTGAVAQIALATPAPNLEDEAQTSEAQTEDFHSEQISGEDVRARYHSVTFTGLLSDTLYAYRVGDGEVWSEWFHARTASREAAPLTFLYFGDAQNGIHSHWSRTIRSAYLKAPDALFMIHAGDLVNSAHRNAEWGEWFTAGGWIHGMLPSVPVPGNHEYRPFTEEEDTLNIDHLSVHWRPQFTLPEHGPEGLEETTYYLDVQGVRIVGLNSNERIEEQAAWLDSILTDNPNRWTVATFHHPIFSSSEGRDSPERRAAWKPILDKHHVDLVLQGHDHTYARGHTENLAQGVNTRDPQAGTVYVNSVSGAKMYEIRPDRWDAYEDVQMDRAAENTQLFQVIRVASDTLRYHAYTATGDVYDAFDLVKQDDEAPNRFIERIEADVPERTHENTVPQHR